MPVTSTTTKKNHVRFLAVSPVRSFFFFFCLVRIATTEKFGKEFEEFWATGHEKRNLYIYMDQYFILSFKWSSSIFHVFKRIDLHWSFLSSSFFFLLFFSNPLFLFGLTVRVFCSAILLSVYRSVWASSLLSHPLVVIPPFFRRDFWPADGVLLFSVLFGCHLHIRFLCNCLYFFFLLWLMSLVFLSFLLSFCPILQLSRCFRYMEREKNTNKYSSFNRCRWDKIILRTYRHNPLLC